MEITKAVKPFIGRGANTFGNIVYVLYSRWECGSSNQIPEL